jgi:hypothetical protein
VQPVARSKPLTKKQKAGRLLAAVLLGFVCGVYALSQRQFQLGLWLLGYCFTAVTFIILTKIPTHCNVLTQR